MSTWLGIARFLLRCWTCYPRGQLCSRRREVRTRRSLLPGGFPGYDDLVSLPDGSVMATHKTISGGSLVFLSAVGTVRWRRAYSDLLPGRKRLFVSGDRAYLAVETHATSSSQVALYEVDLDGEKLVRLFTGGTRSNTPAHTWQVMSRDRFVVHIGSAGTIALDPETASQAALGEGTKD